MIKTFIPLIRKIINRYNSTYKINKEIHKRLMDKCKLNVAKTKKIIFKMNKIITSLNKWHKITRII